MKDTLINIIGNKDTKICSFDVNEETRRHEPWTGNDEENKKMLDTFIKGGKYIYRDSRGEQIIDFSGGLYQYKNKLFTENLGEYTYNTNGSETSDENDNSGLVKNKKKRVIIYTLQN